MYLKKMYLIIISSVVVLLIGIGIFQFVYLKMNTAELKGSYEEQLISLETVISNFGTMGSVWTVSNQTIPGQEVTMDDLVPVEMLNKNISKTYIIDPKKIIGRYYKIALKPGTPLTEDVFMDQIIADTVRQFEVVTSTIPVGLQVGDYIDYRFLLPRGEDYIVMPHKRVEGLYGKVITLHMTEEEIHTYQSLLLDYFINNGSQIYLTKYLEPGIQKPAQQYYPIANNILNLISIDPNVTELIEESIIKKRRVILDNALKSVTEDIISKIGSGRTTIQSDLDSANLTFNERIEMRKQQNLLNGENSADALIQSEESSPIPSSDKLKQDMKDQDQQKLVEDVTQNEEADNIEQNPTTPDEKNSSTNPTTPEKKNTSNNSSETIEENKIDGVVK